MQKLINHGMICAIYGKRLTFISLLDGDYDPVAQLDRVSVSEADGHEFESHRGRHLCKLSLSAKVAELVDALASGVSIARCVGSSPIFRTT